MFSGGRLKEYQLAGLTWLVSLHNNRLNGILGRRDGPRENHTNYRVVGSFAGTGRAGAFLVVAPLSTLSNWSHEFAKWCARGVLFHRRGGARRRWRRRWRDDASMASTRRHVATTPSTSTESPRRRARTPSTACGGPLERRHRRDIRTQGARHDRSNLQGPAVS